MNHSILFVNLQVPIIKGDNDNRVLVKSSCSKETIWMIETKETSNCLYRLILTHKS